MEQSEKKKLILLFGIFGITLLMVYFNLLLKPQFAGFIRNNRECITIKRRVKATENMIASKQQKETQLKNLQNYSESLEKGLPNNDEISGLLGDFSKIAKESGVEITKIQPIDKKDTRQDLTKKQDLPYTDYPILIEAIAGYHQSVAFVRRLENLNTFLEIKELTISQRKEDYRRHKIELNLKTYIMED
ncbi:MAG: type 4a pilus biogenesis protein PilO [Candidatus Omnitrophota bacterium]